jgi:Ni,Fe-hydrogenase III small subunit
LIEHAGLNRAACFSVKNLCQKMFGRSLWVYHANSGGCNGCDIEVLNVLTPYYDVERFGIKLVGSPRHADVMLCQGPALRSTARACKRAYEAMPAPKLVFAIGGCACGGGIWHDTYAVLGPVEKVIPVNYYIPGCPPRPEAIIYGVAVASAWWTRKSRRSIQAVGIAHPALPPPPISPARDEMVVYEKMDKI